MAFQKTARKQYTCGECKHFDKEKSICKHGDMNNRSVTAYDLTPCGIGYFQPMDDYKHN